MVIVTIWENFGNVNALVAASSVSVAELVAVERLWVWVGVWCIRDVWWKRVRGVAL